VFENDAMGGSSGICEEWSSNEYVYLDGNMSSVAAALGRYPVHDQSTNQLKGNIDVNV
jgi:hypothetical protein